MRKIELNMILAGSVLASLLLAGCGGAGAGPKPSAPVPVPPTPGEVWTLVPPAEVGMHAETLNKAVSTLPEARQHLLSSMVVLRHGKPVLEQYWNGFDKDTLHDMRSATKSITSLMVGIAIDKGMLDNEAAPMRQHLESAYLGAPALAHDISLKDLLTMSSGLDCNDWDTSSKGNEEYMYPKADWISFFVNLPTTAAGKVTRYCTAGVVTLGRIVSEASKQTIPDFSSRYLFAPLGISHVRWDSFDQQRQTDTGGHLHMRPRDMAKVGQLVLQKGMWNGKQLVSPEWLARSTSKQTMMGKTEQYGYLWWIRTFTTAGGKSYLAHYARGNGGQYIIVIPELDMVAVFTGENYNTSGGEIAFTQLSSYVLPAVL